MKKLIILFISIIVVLGAVYFLFPKEVRIVCTSDCNRICDPEERCCWHSKCVSGGCEQPGKDLDYYENLGFVGINSEIYMQNWTQCRNKFP